MGKDRQTKTSRKEAASARAEQVAREKRRERTVRIIGSAAVITVVATIIGLAVFIPRLSGDTTAGGGMPEPDPNAAIPTGVYGPDSPAPWGVPVGTAPETAPLLELWEDFQCPACGNLEQLNGAGIRSLAETGKARLVWRPTAFLDANLRNTSSSGAINAWGCAIDAGKTVEYHDTLYANQPTTEGTGWTNEQFLGFAEQAGITGEPLTQFTECVNSGRYLGWAANTTKAFFDAGIQGTPAGVLNGTPIDAPTLADQAALEKLIETATTQP